MNLDKTTAVSSTSVLAIKDAKCAPAQRNGRLLIDFHVIVPYPAITVHPHRLYKHVLAPQKP